MGKLLAKARTRVGVAVIGGAVLVLAAGGFATAAVIDSPATDEVSDVSTVTTQPAETTAPTVAAIPEATDAPAPVPADSPAADAPAANVEGVTEPAQTSAPEPEPTQPYDPSAPWVDPSGVTFIPAPERTPEPPQALD